MPITLSSRHLTDSELFLTLRVEDSCLRAQAAEKLCKILNEWADSNDDQLKRRVISLFPSIMRLSHECPFKSIRDSFVSLESHLRNLPGISLPFTCSRPSQFLRQSSLPLISSIDSSSPLLPWFEDMFLIRGRITHLDQVIAILPKFAAAYFGTYNFVMRESGPLPLTWRNYLAILASSRFRCEYLVRFQESEFILNGGEPQWLRGVKYAPDKLQSFLQLNAYMAHRPWLIHKSMIADIVRSGISMSELVHAMMVLSMFHALCGFVYGLDITPETDIDVSNSIFRSDAVKTEAHPDSKCAHLEDNTAIQTLKHLLESNIDTLIAENAVADPFESAGSDGQVPTESACVNPPHTNISSTPDAYSLPPDANAFDRFVGDVEPDLQYANYDVKSDEYSVFRIQDYNWKDHGFSLVMRYYNAAHLLDCELDGIYNLTDSSLSEVERSIDTGPFRRAIWHYAHRLFGISDDSYNYQEVNIFLHRQIKTFVKKVTCWPSTVGQCEFRQLGLNFRADECVHITLLGVEGRRRAELLYALHAMYELHKDG